MNARETLDRRVTLLEIRMGKIENQIQALLKEKA